MSKIRSKNTKLEVLVFRELRKRGVYFQKHYERVVGKPDIALPRKRKAVFLDGDFWHGYDFPDRKRSCQVVFGSIKSKAILDEIKSIEQY